jgi:manganese/zinc/iron transport system substrate-binding protein
MAKLLFSLDYYQMAIRVKRGRRIRVGLLAMVLLSFLPFHAFAATNASNDPGNDRIRITATVGMIGDIVRNVGGERVEVTSLMGPGVDPHVYKPTAGDVGRLDQAEIIFYGGLELEGRMTDIFAKIAKSGKPTYAVSDEIPAHLLRQLDGMSNHHDPHIWFDVTLWQLAVDSVRDHLSTHYPDDAATFAANAASYQAELTQLDQYIRDQVATIPEQQRVLVTAHDAFGYFGAQYGFEVLGVQGISTSSEAGTADIQNLVDFIVERRIPAMFVESSVSPATIEAVQAAANDRGWDVVVGGQLFSDAMGQSGTPEGTYIGMVTFNVNTIVAALRGEATNQGDW